MAETTDVLGITGKHDFADRMLARLGQVSLVTEAAEVNLMLTPTDDLTPEQRARRAALECLVNLDMKPELAASQANRDNHKAQTAGLEPGYYWLFGMKSRQGRHEIAYWSGGARLFTFNKNYGPELPRPVGPAAWAGGDLIMAAEAESMTLFAIEVSTSDEWGENLLAWIQCCYADEAMAVTHMAKLNAIREARVKGKGDEQGQEPYYRIQQVIM